MVTFGKEKSFLDFYLVYKRFCFKILGPIQQKLKMAKLFWNIELYEKVLN